MSSYLSTQLRLPPWAPALCPQACDRASVPSPPGLQARSQRTGDTLPDRYTAAVFEFYSESSLGNGYVKKAWKLTVPLFVLSLSGAYISVLLLDKHLLKSHGPSWFATVCGDEMPEQGAEEASTSPGTAEASPGQQPRPERTSGGPATAGGASCDTVLASRWATIPPRPAVDDELPAKPHPQVAQISIPAAYLGFVYFISLAIWFLFVGRPTPDRREWYRIPLGFVICGVGSSVFFTFIMFTQNDEWCPWCMVTHVINFLILIGMIMLRPVRVEALSPVPTDPIEPCSAEAAVGATGTVGAKGAPAGTAEVSEPVRPHPSYRLAAACVLLSAATCAMVWNGYAVQVVRRQKQVLDGELEKFRENVQFLFAAYKSGPEVKIQIRPDDPQYANGEVLCPLVVFSDFQCPSCGGFARQLEKQIRPLFHDHLRITWKHYPLSTDCNKTIRNNVHPEACAAARAAEAARMQGGSEAFWRAHDILFKAGRKLKDFDYPAMAEELGLDPQRFEADMYSEETAARIAEDIAQARKLGVNSTPTAFLMGRKVDPVIRSVQPFWEYTASRFNMIRERKLYKRKQRESGKQAGAKRATPDTPDRSGAR